MEWNEFKYQLKEFAESLDIRGRINRNPKPFLALAIITFSIFAAVVISMLGDGAPPPLTPPNSEWYYDLNTGKLFAAEEGLTPPIDAPSGPSADGSAAGVRAHVFTYVEEPNESEYYIGFIETQDTGGMKLIRRVPDPNWQPVDSPQGRTIITEAFVPDANGEPPSQYYPK
jgi:hypothetical protein